MLNWLRKWRASAKDQARSTKSRQDNCNPDNDYTRPATWDDVLTTVRLLNQAGARYILVGGYALACHGYVRMTTDIDIAVAPDQINSARWIAALAWLPDGVCKEMAGESDPFNGDHLHAIRLNDEFTVDILPSVGGISFRELEQHVEWMNFEGESVPVLNLIGLLKTKQGLRPKDQADASVLRQALAAISAQDRDSQERIESQD